MKKQTPVFLRCLPILLSDFQYEKYDRLRLVVDFSTTGYNIASFSALSSTAKRPLDLGIAFVNLPPSVYPCVAIVTGGAKEQIEVGLDYVSGPKGLSNFNICIQIFVKYVFEEWLFLSSFTRYKSCLRYTSRFLESA